MILFRQLGYLRPFFLTKTLIFARKPLTLKSPARTVKFWPEKSFFPSCRLTPSSRNPRGSKIFGLSFVKFELIS